LLENKDYKNLHALLDDVLEVRQHPDRLGTHNFEVPDNIPKNIALIQKPPKQQAVDAHITRFTKQPQNKYCTEISTFYLSSAALNPVYTLSGSGNMDRTAFTTQAGTTLLFFFPRKL